VFFEAPHRIQATLQELEREIGDCQVVIWRELTKIHETMVKGPISDVLEGVLPAKGEFTVVVNLGEIVEDRSVEAVEPSVIVAELGILTKSAGITKRKALNIIAKKHGIPPNRLYAMVEETKKSG
jgi:16S rRNA (cytidine1402-2'-O)-methyltransferase